MNDSPQEHDQLYLSEEALFTQGFFVPEYIHWQLSRTLEISLLCIWVDTVTIKGGSVAPRPPKGLSGTQLLTGRLVSV